MKFENLVIEKLAKGIIDLNSITFPENIISIAKELIVDISGVTLAGSLACKIRHFAYLMRMPGFSLSLKSAGSRLLSKK